MAVDLSALVPQMKTAVDALVAACAARQIEMRPYVALRTPEEQARLWRQSRSSEQIAAEVTRLQRAGAPYLADCLQRVGPQHGPPVTKAVPGLSWHQWGEAVDFFWALHGKAEWSVTFTAPVSGDFMGENGYHVLVDEAQKLNLHPGGAWKRFQDWPHVQLHGAASPADVMSLAEIDRQMAERFGP